ncbi:DNA-directed_RNA polymerase subunit [Hexamita inflata]|uniref:DNA-directed RNA polymerase subunit n=1 Tax=Hexamita inflata TaxID=28002 RepID=A0AA86PY28_9EUKA|nr:DNA-directed RNA polymerase subunit [Hexamita inflata]CAI9943082.1 DNA-directed RNA polymerase subunit [Hexamita inflata]
MKEQKLSISRGKIVGIQFSAMPRDVIKKLPQVCPCESQHDQYKELEDKHLGVVFQEDGECQTCHGTAAVRVGEMPCPGHMGAIHLSDSQFIFHPMLIDKLVFIMNMFCPSCYRLKMRVLLDNQKMMKKEDQDAFISQLQKRIPMYKFLQQTSEKCKDMECCDMKCHFKALESINKLQKTSQYKNSKQSSQSEEQTPQDALKFLNNLHADDLKLLGLENAHPSDMVMQYIPVAPVCCRPNISSMGMVSRDQMTDQYQRLLKLVSQRTNDDQKEKELNREMIAESFKSIIKTSSEEAESTDQKSKGIAERLKGKQGRMRMNIMGKRVNFCSRSVISGDPTISVDQLGVPRSVAMRLTFPEPVTERNIDFLTKLVKNGTQYPGANAIERADGIVKLELASKDTIQLQIGDIVHRHLLDDDYVMFNRQPSLHKMSFMAHKAKILPYSTFRLNLCCTRPYNADFDGDEMNCHEPQSYQAITELAEIMLVSKQIVSCKNNAPLISIVQDSLVGCFMLTQKDKFIIRQDFQKYMMFLEYPDAQYKQIGTPFQSTEKENAANHSSANSFTQSGSFVSSSETQQGVQNSSRPLACIKTCQPAIIFPEPMWTGKQMFSLSMPDKLSMTIGKVDDIQSDKAITILNGELLSGVASSKLVGQAQGGLIHILFNDFSHDYCKAFLNNCQRTFTQMMIDHSFSIGFGDMIIDNDSRQDAFTKNNELFANNAKVFNDSINNKIKLAPGQTNEQGFEGKFQQVLQETSKKLVEVVRKFLPKRNALICMADSGSKGKDLNIQQIAACVGQQMLQGNRMTYRFLTNRSLPHFQPFDYSLHSRGYVSHSFIQGLDAPEFWFHMTGGREGVCDTSIKTADSGYVERKMMKNMESVSQGYDNSVRNDQNGFVQLRYGDDNLNTHFCETQEYKSIGLTDKEFFSEFFVDYNKQTAKSRRRVDEEQVIGFGELINEFADLQQLGLYDFALTSKKLKEFQVVVDPDLVKHPDLLAYLQMHIAKFVEEKEDQTPTLSAWLSDEAINKLKMNQQILKLEYLTLLAERFWLQSNHTFILQLSQAKTAEFLKNTSCDLLRIINNQKTNQISQKTPLIISDSNATSLHCDSAVTDLDPVYVVYEVNKLLREIAQFKSQESKILRAMIRLIFNSKQMCYKFRLSPQHFKNCMDQIRKKFYASNGVPGEPVGPLASHSISEPATQLTLNTFHTAGTSALGSLGLPRLKELIDFRPTKTPIMTIYMKNGAEHAYIKQTSEHKGRVAMQQKQVMKVAALIENSYFQDFVKQMQVIFDPNGSFEPDLLWLDYARATKFYPEVTCPFVLRYEISLKKMLEKDESLTLLQIVQIIRHEYPDFETSYYSGMGTHVIRMRPHQLLTPTDLTNVNTQLAKLHISGFEKVKKVFQDSVSPFVHFGFDQFAPVDTENANFGGIYKSDLATPKDKDDKSEPQIQELIIKTEGSDLITVLGMDDVDETRTIVNDLPEVYNVLGVEAARQLLVTEMRITLPSDGLNPRHFGLLADVMMSSPSCGKMISINRHGMRITNTGVVAQASFEQPADAFLAGAAFGLHDNCQAVSTAVTIGSEMRHGTSSFDLLLDCSKLPALPDTEHPGRVVQDKKRILLELDKQNSVAQDAVSNANSTRGEHVFTVVSHKTTRSRSQTFSRYSTHNNSVISGLVSQKTQSGGNLATQMDPYRAISVKSKNSYNSQPSSGSVSKFSVNSIGLLSKMSKNLSKKQQAEPEAVEKLPKEDSWM